MKRLRLAPLLLVLLLAPAFSTAARAEDIASLRSGTRWLSAEEGLKEGKRLGKPVLVVAWARWCPACRQMFKEVFGGGDANPFTREFQKRFVLAEVEVDANPGRGIRYNGTKFGEAEFANRFIDSPGIPWFTVFGPDGRHAGVSFDGARLPQAMYYFSEPKVSSKMTFERFLSETAPK